MTSDIISRLSETLDELEGVAREGAGVVDTPAGPVRIVAWDPDSVLRLVDSVRGVIAKYRTAQTTVGVSEGTILAGATRVSMRAYGETLKLLASGFGIEESDVQF